VRAVCPFALLMFIAPLRINKALQVVFGTLALLFLLTLENITASAVILTITGYKGIICSFTVIYAAMAQVINEVYGKMILPIGEVN